MLMLCDKWEHIKNHIQLDIPFQIYKAIILFTHLSRCLFQALRSMLFYGSRMVARALLDGRHTVCLPGLTSSKCTWQVK